MRKKKTGSPYPFNCKVCLTALNSPKEVGKHYSKYPRHRVRRDGVPIDKFGRKLDGGTSRSKVQVVDLTSTTTAVTQHPRTRSKAWRFCPGCGYSLE